MAYCRKCKNASSNPLASWCYDESSGSPFRQSADLVGATSITVDLPVHATVADLRRRLGEDCPSLIRLLERSAIAVNNEFAADAIELTSDADVALLPPVSGG